MDCQANWKLALKGGETSRFGFSSSYWTNHALYNSGSSVTNPSDAKYSAFVTEPFKRIRMCVGSPEANCVSHAFSREYNSARAF